jgi:hypothetical protein
MKKSSTDTAIIYLHSGPLYCPKNREAETDSSPPFLCSSPTDYSLNLSPEGNGTFY